MSQLDATFDLCCCDRACLAAAVALRPEFIIPSCPGPTMTRSLYSASIVDCIASYTYWSMVLSFRLFLLFHVNHLYVFVFNLHVRKHTYD